MENEDLLRKIAGVEAKADALAELLLMANGERFALRVIVGALMQSHPNRTALAAALRQETLQAARHWDQFPDQGVARFRAEQLLEDWAAALGS